MTTAIKRRRGTTAQHSTFTGLDGEITVDSTKKTLVVHDGATAGGFPLPTLTGSETLTNKALNGTLGATTPSTVVATTGTFKNALMTNPIVLSGSATNTNYGLLSFNNVDTAAGTVGIWGGADSDIRYNVPTGGSHIFRTNNVTQATIDASGNVGIGVTPSAWYTSGFVTTQIGAAGIFSAIAANDLRITDNAYLNTSGVYKYLNTDYATRYEQGAGTHAWFTAPSGTAGNTATFTQAMTLDASGNLLVGANSYAGTGVKSINITGQYPSLAMYDAANTNRCVITSSASGITEYYSAQHKFYNMSGTLNPLLLNAVGGVQHLNTISVGNATPATSGAGITFPATQSASTDANTLDDYEEGTWTPTLISGGCSGTAYYTKIGRQVTINGTIAWTSDGAGVVGVTINNLPFTAATSTYGFAGWFGIALDAGDTQAGSFINANSTLVFAGFPSGSGIDASRWLTGSTLIFNITYIV